MRGSEFAELKAFAAIVERASFARAADHLGLSPSALSQTIRQLEARLGVRLLNRTTRSVAPTTAGSRLHERIAPMIREVDAAVAEAVAATGRTAGTLRINTLGMAAKKIIAPRLGRFHRAHPDVVLDIVIDDGLSDIVAGRFDAGIRVGERLEKDGTLAPESGLEDLERLGLPLLGRPGGGDPEGLRIGPAGASEEWHREGGCTPGENRAAADRLAEDIRHLAVHVSLPLVAVARPLFAREVFPAGASPSA